jgi:hypothetical protein
MLGLPRVTVSAALRASTILDDPVDIAPVVPTLPQIGACFDERCAIFRTNNAKP